MVQLVPDDPEVLSLTALVAFAHARRPALFGSAGSFVPLSEQSPDLWSQELIDEAEAYLGKAQLLGQPGRFQLEATIQSAHCHRRTGSKTDWQAIVVLDAGLISIMPTLGAIVAQAAAIGQWLRPDQGLAGLDRFDPEALGTFQPWHAT
jgi:RNA polymerase sigma-70 factor (ECF subfamily)